MIENIKVDAHNKVALADSLTDLDDLLSQFIGKKGSLTNLKTELRNVTPELRPTIGKQLNEAFQSVKAEIEEKIEALRTSINTFDGGFEDLTVGLAQISTINPGLVGHMHLVSQTTLILEDTFLRMGFSIEEGPEIETDWHNFEALNIPPSHPARGMWDTFYLDTQVPETQLLRTHTSPVQIRVMQAKSLPIYSVMPGRCYRRDTPDARHLATFHQIEGLVVDKGITFSHLAGTIDTFTKAYFGEDINSRLRPAFFPFTEPSAEFEITCTICRGKGCRTCSNTGWIELGGAGMVDPNVFEAVGIDPEEYSGFAFGFGIDRLAQMKHSLPDMRQLAEHDFRFLSQF